ncbi:OPT oligopeptide transporter [Mycena sp. CBHHK59/15]|nr:OPT oligopeptide transporter [Mycena sp. CBHHK59/15]
MSAVKGSSSTLDLENAPTAHVAVLDTADIPEFDDPNMEPDVGVVGIVEDDSPYPEVRSAVANTDHPTIPVSTIRAWVLGLIWATIIPGPISSFSSDIPLSLSPECIVAQLLFLPMGRLWAQVLPNVKIFGLELNPGPFSIKEHVLVTIMASVGAGSAYATDIVAVQRVYYNQTYNFSFQWLIVMSTQLIGFSIGGIARRFLVQPPSMIWPANLVTCALFNTLHSTDYASIGNRGGYSRERFFYVAFACSAVWYLLPGYLFTALSYFSWVCWIAPNNNVNQLFSVNYGLGMGLLTFDWAQIAYIGSPLATPWWRQTSPSTLCSSGSTPALYFTNTWYSKYMPISSGGFFDNTGAKYNVSPILTPESTFDQAAYEAYSPLFLSTTFAVSYGLSFASITATFTHAFLFFRKQIWTHSRRAMNEQPDVHARLMTVYPQVPEWWYAIIFVTMFVCVAIEVWDTKFPVQYFILALVVAFFYIIPIGMIQAITNQQVGLNVITELIIGYALPGHPIAMMMFKTWGYITMAQALTFASDFKLGHYMKIPPRSMFWGQVVATVLAGTVQLGVQAWMFTNIPGMCDRAQKDGFWCPSTGVFGTASIVWVSKGQIYSSLTFFFLIGFLCPLGGWLYSKKWPHGFVRYLNFPVIFSGTGSIPPASAINYVPWAIVGFIFQYVIRHRHFAWWTKYNYVLSAAMDSGLAISAIFIFFVLQYLASGSIRATTIQTWWGNTLDGQKTPLISLAEGQTFGPTEW